MLGDCWILPFLPRRTLYSEEGSAIDKIQAILHEGREMVAIDPSLSPLLKTTESTLIQLEEVARA